jgi:cytochrome c-type biogenesis protein
MVGAVTAALREGGAGVFIIVFLAGIVLSLTSCTVARLPVVLGYLGSARDRRRAVANTFAFAGGMIPTFVAIGVAFGMTASMLVKATRASTWFYTGFGIVAILIGLHVLGVVVWRLPRLGFLGKARSGSLQTAGALALGVSFALIESPVCPCCGPVALLIGAYTVAKGKLALGIGLFLAYSIGQSVPLLLIGSSSLISSFLARKSHRFEELFSVFAGCLLVSVGTYFVWIA